MACIEILTWDGQSNPFDSELAPVCSTEPECVHSDGVLSAALNDLFRRHFALLFLAEGSHVHGERHLFSSDSEDECNLDCSLIKATVERWASRLQHLEVGCAGSDSGSASSRQLFYLETLLVQHLPPAHHRVEVWIHPRFDRMFTAVSERPRMFCSSAGPFDTLEAARVVHECAHLCSGFTLGWQRFQQMEPADIEGPALRAERSFLVGQIGIDRWASSLLRLEWNRSLSAEHLGLLQVCAAPAGQGEPLPFDRGGRVAAVNEALLYLTLLECIDPI